MALLSGCRDEIIQLTRAEAGTVLRLVSFRCGRHAFRLVTNRFDLTTAQVLRLSSWRWQVALLFRAWKHTLGALHLINLSEDEIAIQFQVLLLASLWWGVWQQPAAQQAAAAGAPLPKRPRTLTAQWSQVLQVRWRRRQPALRLLANCLPQPLSVYWVEWAELKL